MEVTSPEVGIAGSKPIKPRFKSAREELPELNRIYIEERNAKLALQRRAAEIELAEKEGRLISRQRAKLQLGFLLTGLRQRMMSFSYALPRRLVGKSEHEIGRIIDEEARAMLRDLPNWPEKMVNPAWVEEIDSDLIPEEVNGEARGQAKGLAKLEQEQRAETAVGRWNAKRREKRKKKG